MDCVTEHDEDFNTIDIVKDDNLLVTLWKNEFKKADELAEDIKHLLEVNDYGYIGG